MDAERLRLRVYLTIFSMLLIAGTTAFMALEDLSLVDALYFSIVTMATVGYGDIHPQTTGGKILALLMIVGGVGTFLGVVASFTELFIQRRSAEVRRQKRNMVAGLFFSEMGTELLRLFFRLDADAEALGLHLQVSDRWSDADFKEAQRRVAAHRFAVELQNDDLPALKSFLEDRGGLLLRLLENPLLLEHGDFTELLRAAFHLRDELLNRPDVTTLPASDRKHLAGDIVRVDRLLITQWLDYMHYLKGNYGYLLSLAVRTLPFDADADAVVKA